MPQASMQFSKDQQRIIDERSKSLVVSASAGSGKTAVLVERLCKLVLDDHIPLDAVLAVTFTEDAAREIKSRLKNRLLRAKKELVDQKKNDSEELDYLNRQLTLLETAQISTIHGFCLNLVRQYYYLLGLEYSLTQTIETGLLDDQALEIAYRQALASLSSEEYCDLKLYFEAFGKEEDFIQEMILSFLDMAQTKPDPIAWMKTAYQPPFSEDFYQFFSRRVEAIIEIFEDYLELLDDPFFPNPTEQRRLLDLLDKKITRLKKALEQLEKKEYSAFRDTFLGYLTETGGITPQLIAKKKATKTRTASEAEADNQLAEPFNIKGARLHKLFTGFEEDIVKNLYSEQKFIETHQQLERIARTFIELAILTQEKFAQEKRKQGFMDFSDMEQFAHQLLQENPQTRKELQDRFQAVLIDEFQDTNELQHDILEMVSGKDNVFRVGDLKQSIYRFRQAKPDLMKGLIEDTSGAHEVIFLKENYRTKESLVEFNNYFYDKLMNAGFPESQFSQMDKAQVGTEGQKSGSQPPVRFLYTEYSDYIPEGKDKPDLREGESVHNRYRLDLLAQDIRDQVDRQKREYRDITILSRTTTSHEKIAEALEAYGIPCITHERSGFYTNQAVQVVLSALKALVNPRDDVSLMAYLCSKLGGSNQAEIAEAAVNRSDFPSLYDTLYSSSILKDFKRLQKTIPSLSPADALLAIYNHRQYYYYYTNGQDKTNLDLLMQKAVEAADTMSLEEFLNQATLDADLDRTSEAYPYGKESNVVRVSTIHSSKGLEYPIVYLLSEHHKRDMESGWPIHFDSDLGLSLKGLDEKGKFTSSSASHLAIENKRYEEELAEKMRLLYVATTRAKDELIIIDTIKNLDEYADPLSTPILLNNDTFTPWFFHIANNHPSNLFRLEQVSELKPRPSLGKPKPVRIDRQIYRQPVTSIFNMTASKKEKNIAKWSPIRLEEIEEDGKVVEVRLDQARMERGTIFHELAQKLSFPYQRRLAEGLAHQYGYTLSQEDWEELSSLNQNETFRNWMNLEYAFEYPYVVRETQNTEEGQSNLTHGFMDFVAFDENDIYIIDFKTDRRPVESLLGQYREQLNTYENAMRLIHPDKKIHTYLYSFNNRQLVAVNE